MLIASEASLFAAFIGTFFYLRFQPPLAAARRPRSRAWSSPIVLAALLADELPDAGCFARGARAAGSAGRGSSSRSRSRPDGYLVYAGPRLLGPDLQRLTPTGNAYSSIHFVLLGADHAHVFVGILFYVWLLWKLAARPHDLPR